LPLRGLDEPLVQLRCVDQAEVDPIGWTGIGVT
jgi:hypothetical protein